MSKRIVVISDTQMPYEDRKALSAVFHFISDYQPDEVVQIGDLVDYPQPSRWSKGTREEFEGSIFRDSEYAEKNFLAPLRAIYDGPIGVIEGNHDLRPRTYLEKYAPALAGTGAFNLDQLLKFDDYEVTLLPDFYKFARGLDWVMTHGHVGGISLSRFAANTAVNAARKFDTSVIMGHTHRLGVGSHTVGYGGDTKKVLTGFEVGNLMDMKSATYLRQATGNWQQGFGLVEIGERHVQCTPIRIEKRRFIVQGTTYRV